VKAVFADTAYFLALVSQRDRLHAQAMALAQNPPGDLLTTEWILTEVGDGLSAPTVRSRFVRLCALLRSREDVEIVPATSQLFERGRTLFAASRRH
jgi:predicted nucleic acid-binding protein